MAALAFLEAPLPCPACATVVSDQTWFRWGFCRGRGQAPESTYRLGDAIRWRTCPDGTTPAWTQFSTPDGSAGANLGTPLVRDVLVRDTTQEWLYGPCPTCGVSLDGAMVEIRDGVVVGAGLLRPGTLPPAEYHVPDPDSDWREAPWDEDGPLDVRDDC